jgi:hypothetical protein
MKKFSMMLFLAALLVIVPAILAQDTLNASQEDYDLWTSANAATSEVQTLTFGLTANVTVAGMGDSNVTLDVSGSGLLDSNPAAPQFQLDLTGSAAQGTETTPLSLGVRSVDGMVYFNSNDEGWKGGTAQSMLGELQGLGLPVDPTALGSGDLSSLGNNPMMSDVTSALAGLQPSDFLTLTSADEAGLKNLTINVDVPKLLSSPAVAPLFGTVMSMGGGSGSGAAMSAAQLQQMQTMFAGAFSTATISLSELVDPATNMVNRVALNVNIPLDAMIGPGALVSASFELNLSNFDQPVSVVAPEGAEIVDTSAGG